MVVLPVSNARARRSVEAALEEAKPRRAELEAYYRDNGRFPEGSAAIELHPEGAHGVIRLTPDASAGQVRWRCTAEGITRGQLPLECREN
jgi:hypothetical protein